MSVKCRKKMFPMPQTHNFTHKPHTQTQTHTHSSFSHIRTHDPNVPTHNLSFSHTHTFRPAKTFETSKLLSLSREWHVCGSMSIMINDGNCVATCGMEHVDACVCSLCYIERCGNVCCVCVCVNIGSSGNVRAGQFRHV